MIYAIIPMALLCRLERPPTKIGSHHQSHFCWQQPARCSESGGLLKAYPATIPILNLLTFLQIFPEKSLFSSLEYTIESASAPWFNLRLNSDLPIDYFWYQMWMVVHENGGWGSYFHSMLPLEIISDLRLPLCSPSHYGIYSKIHNHRQSEVSSTPRGPRAIRLEMSLFSIIRRSLKVSRGPSRLPRETHGGPNARIWFTWTLHLRHHRFHTLNGFHRSFHRPPKAPSCEHTPHHCSSSPHSHISSSLQTCHLLPIYSLWHLSSAFKA